MARSGRPPGNAVMVLTLIACLLLANLGFASGFACLALIFD